MHRRMRDAPSSPLLVSRSPDVLPRLPSPVRRRGSSPTRRRMRARVARWHGNPESETGDDATEEGDDDRRPRCHGVLLKLWPLLSPDYWVLMAPRSPHVRASSRDQVRARMGVVVWIWRFAAWMKGI